MHLTPKWKQKAGQTTPHPPLFPDVCSSPVAAGYSPRSSRINTSPSASASARPPYCRYGCSAARRKARSLAERIASSGRVCERRGRPSVVIGGLSHAGAGESRGKRKGGAPVTRDASDLAFGRGPTPDAPPVGARIRVNGSRSRACAMAGRQARI